MLASAKRCAEVAKICAVPPKMPIITKNNQSAAAVGQTHCETANGPKHNVASPDAQSCAVLLFSIPASLRVIRK